MVANALDIPVRVGIPVGQIDLCWNLKQLSRFSVASGAICSWRHQTHPMRNPKALVLYAQDEGKNTEMFRTLLPAEGCELKLEPLSPEAPGAGDGYCLVLFYLQRLTPPFLDVIRTWRDNAPDTTLIVVGKRTARTNRIAVLEAGADAYFAKPLAVAELQAHVRIALRRFRSQDTRPRSFSFGAGTIDLEARMVRAGGRDAHLTPTECEILGHLLSNLNQTVSSGQLVKTLWGNDPQKGAHSLRPFIRSLRSKLEPDPAHPRHLVTEPAIGYRLMGILNGSVNT